MAALDVTCSRRFKAWWQRCARHYASGALHPIPEGYRYGLLWYAYRTGWRHARQALQGSVLGSPRLPAGKPRGVVVETDEPAPR